MATQQRMLLVIGVAVLLGLVFVPVAAGGGGVDSNPLVPDTAATHTDNDTTETAVVRFSDGAQTADISSTADLQAHAEDSQATFADAADESPYVDIQESLWLANAMLIEYDSSVLSEDDLTNVSGADRVHPNFNVSVNSSSQTASNTTTDHSTTQDTETTYGLDMVRAPETWETYDTQGEGVGVAVLDTGVDDDHADIELEDWAHFDSNGNPVDSEPQDNDGHGTHVAGTVAGGDASGTAIGVAPEADLYGIKALDDDGFGTFTQIIAGMEWATERDNEIDILQMSLGSEGYHDEFIEPVENARDAGQIVSAAIGNDGQETSGTPGNIYTVLSAGAVDQDKNVPTFSSGEVIDTDDAWEDEAPDDWPDEYTVPNLSAPGVNVLSANAGTEDELTGISGTSMASPHVAGSAALVLSIFDSQDEIAPRETEEILTSTADHPDGTGSLDTEYGYGIVDSFAAATEAFDGGIVTGEVTGSDEPLESATVESSEGTSTATDANGEYELSVPAGEQDITASAFGWAPATTSINIEDGEIINETDFELEETTDVAVRTDAPSRVNPGESYPVEFDLANVDTYSVSIDGVSGDGAAINSELFTIEHDDEEIDSAINVDGDSLDLSVTSNESAFGTATLNHTFTGTGESESISFSTTTTHVHPDPVHVPDDFDPERLQTVINVLDGGTTLSLDSDTTFDESVDDSQPTAVHIDRSMTLTGDDGTATIDISGSSDDETTGIDIDGVGAHLESVAVSGDVDTGIAMSESDVNATDLSVDGPSVGTVATSGDQLTTATYDNVGTGVIVDTGFTDLNDITATVDDSGVIIEGAVSDAENLDVDLSGSGDGIIIDGGSVGQMSDVSVTDGDTGLEITDTSGADVLDADLDNLETGIVLAESTDVEIIDSTVVADETAAQFTAGTETSTIGDSNLEDGDLVFEDVPFDSNIIDGEYIDRQVTLSATETAITPADEPDSLDSHGPIGAFYNLTSYNAAAETNITVGYDTDETTVVNENSLQFYRFDNGSWNVIQGSTVDTDQQTVSAAVDEYSTIGVYGEGVPFMNINEVLAVSEIQPGDRFDLFANIENQGLVSGTDDVEYQFDGEHVDTAPVTLAPNESEIVSLAHETPDDLAEGEYSFTVSTSNDTYTGTVIVDEEAASANITANVSFDDEIEAGDTLDVTVELTNSGDGDGTFKRTLAVGDTTLVDDVVLIDANDEQSETFSVTLDEPGEYDVLLNDESFGTVTVLGPDEIDDEDDGIPGLGVAAAVIALLIATVWLRYRN